MNKINNILDLTSKLSDIYSGIEDELSFLKEAKELIKDNYSDKVLGIINHTRENLIDLEKQLQSVYFKIIIQVSSIPNIVVYCNKFSFCESMGISESTFNKTGINFDKEYIIINEEKETYLRLPKKINKIKSLIEGLNMLLDM